jgi:hypothetical protein
LADAVLGNNVVYSENCTEHKYTLWRRHCFNVQVDGTYRNHCAKPRKQHEVGNKQSCACYLLHAGFLLGLLFDPEDGGTIFLRNIGWLSVDYTALYPRR